MIRIDLTPAEAGAILDEGGRDTPNGYRFASIAEKIRQTDRRQQSALGAQPGVACGYCLHGYVVFSAEPGHNATVGWCPDCGGTGLRRETP